MKIDRETTPEAIIEEFGARIAHQRIKLGLTQADAAEQAGVGKRTIERIEAGADSQLTTIIRLLRILDLSDYLDNLIPETTVSPMEMLNYQTKPRKRASSKKEKKPSKPWKWGDE
jgi:transcriptional regulator with XRE-family HTH domain